ncbi:MAG: DUF4197 domain-containing protein [Deltaproteobacteria bacterium]|nr:MAG: DUF4197 domain-containing protein [Deltaproteobacteria bacterium]
MSRHLMTILVLSVFLLPTPAQSGWLEQGSNLLRDITGNSSGSNVREEEIGAGLKEALRVGSEQVVRQLARTDGFNADPDIHIPLPDRLDQARSMLAMVGMQGSLDDLELRLNRAAEKATPHARELFIEAIQGLTLDDVMAIYKGPDDAATRYFESRMSQPLAERMRPVVEDSLAQVGAVQSYDNLVGQAKTLPFVPDLKADLTTWVVDRGLKGIFHYLALEEAAIRKNPAKRTTELLKKVFGSGS